MRTIQQAALELLTQSQQIAESTGNHPTLLEALWDGDTSGWCLDLYLTWLDKSKLSATHTRFRSLQFGSDMRLFTGEVPPWPEAKVAKLFASKLEELYGCRLWFPSPNRATDAVASSEESATAISCRGCEKLVSATNNDLDEFGNCNHCRPPNSAQSRAQSPPISGVLVTVKPGASDALCLLYSTKGHGITRHLPDLLRELNIQYDIEADMTISVEVASNMLPIVTESIAQALQAYREPDNQLRRRASKRVSWRGRELLLNFQFNQQHKDLMEIIELAKLIKLSIQSGNLIRIYSNIELSDIDKLAKNL